MKITIILLILAVLVGYAASKKGRSGIGWFLLSVLISPIISIIVLYTAGENKEI